VSAWKPKVFESADVAEGQPPCPRAENMQRVQLDRLGRGAGTSSGGEMAEAAVAKNGNDVAGARHGLQRGVRLGNLGYFH